MRKRKSSDLLESDFIREKCSNPWNGECSSEDIILYIYYEGERLPICRDCWETIASEDFEW